MAVSVAFADEPIPSLEIGFPLTITGEFLRSLPCLGLSRRNEG